ncbi:uncharacterized protein LOC120337557 [Styela clava]
MAFNTTENATNSSVEFFISTTEPFKIPLTICEITNAFLLLSSLLVLLSLIVYGTKTNKWRKTSGTSSLNSGKIYTGCVAVVVITILRLVLNVVAFQLPRMDNALRWCEVICDIGTGAYFISMYATYLFLWMRQRVIFQHPSLRDLTGKWMNVASWISLISLSFVTLAVLYFYIEPNTYSPTPEGCILEKKGNSNKLSYIMMSVLAFSQVLLVSLFIYPMLRSKSVRNLDTKELKSSGSIKKIIKAKRDMKYIFKRLVLGNMFGETIPVTWTIRRSVVSGMLVAVTDLMATIIASLLIAPTIPRTITDTIYSVNLLINVFCIVATLGSNRRILASICINISNERASRTTNESYTSKEYDSEVKEMADSTSSVP